LESEVTRLKEQLGKAKGVNDVMWETIVQQLIPQSGKAREHIEGDPEEESTHRRKRGRI
jgi:pre-rRNA-processing protein IPI3